MTRFVLLLVLAALAYGQPVTGSGVAGGGSGGGTGTAGLLGPVTITAGTDTVTLTHNLALSAPYTLPGLSCSRVDTGVTIPVIPANFTGSTANALVINLSANAASDVQCVAAVGAVGATAGTGTSVSGSAINNAAPLFRVIDSSVGGTDTYTGSPATGCPPEYGAGTVVLFTPLTNNTGAAEFKLCPAQGLASLAIKLADGTSDPPSNALVAGRDYLLTWVDAATDYWRLTPYSSEAIYYHTTSIDSAAILGWNATPVTAVPAQGASWIVWPEKSVLRYAHGGANYANGANIAFYYTNNAGTAITASPTLSASAINAPVSAISAVSLTGFIGGASAAVVNQPVVLQPGVAFISGNGTATLTTYFRLLAF